MQLLMLIVILQLLLLQFYVFVSIESRVFLCRWSVQRLLFEAQKTAKEESFLNKLNLFKSFAFFTILTASKEC